MIKVEIAANNLHSCVAAQQAGAHRIELCNNLKEGGTTPSMGTLLACMEHINIPAYPIIRPRGGNFVYSDAEVKSMIYDIQAMEAVGCKGIVIGCLTNESDIDINVNTQLVKAAKQMEITFHRAFDRSKNAKESIKKIIDIGCKRILTSGKANNVINGLENIKNWIDIFGNQIIIMPGAGVTASNAQEILTATNAQEIHASCKTEIIQNNNCNLENFSSESFQSSSVQEIELLINNINKN